MKNVILMRHSIPVRKYMPTEKIPLSEEGRKLVSTTRNKIIKYSIKKVYTSNYLRAIQTAEVIGFSFEVIDDLHERIIGCETHNFWHKQYLDLDFKNPDGESLNEVKKRMYNSIINLVTKSSDGDTVLIISHATAIFSFLMNYCLVRVVNSEKRLEELFLMTKRYSRGNLIQQIILLSNLMKIII